MVKPIGFCAWGVAEDGREYPLFDYAGMNENEVLSKVLSVGRAQGYKGNVVQLMAKIGWYIKPVYDAPTEPLKPIDMVLHCPHCGTQHIDVSQKHGKMHSAGCNVSCGMSAQGCNCGFDQLWDNPPHRSHECQACKHVWRVSDTHCTNGIASVKTKSKADSPINNYTVDQVFVRDHSRMIRKNDGTTEVKPGRVVVHINRSPKDGAW